MDYLRPLLLLAVLASLHCTVKSLIGGKMAGSPTEFPYMASIEHFGVYQGGAVIVNPAYVLTVAHSVKGKMAITLKVRAGTFSMESSKVSKVQVRKVSSVIVHRNYQDKIKLPDYDLALLKLRAPFELTDHVNVVQLATKRRLDQYTGMQGVILGYGQTERAIVAKKLMRAGVVVLTDEECRDKAPVKLGRSMVCSLGRPDQAVHCVGDSGGPLIVRHSADNPTNDVLVGIASLILEKKNSRYGTPCDPTLPGIFADVGDHQKWIDSHMNKK